MKNQIKMYAMLLTAVVMISSCSTVIDLGKLNMISDRNIDSKMDYVLIKNYAGGSKKEIKKALKRTKALPNFFKLHPLFIFIFVSFGLSLRFGFSQ